MRYFLFFLISIVAFAQQAPRQYTCRKDGAGTLTSLLEHEIVGLRMELYALSEFKAKTPYDVVNLQKVASETVFALANAFSAYGDRFQRCSLSDDEYYEKISQANRMILLLLETQDSEDWWNALSNRWPLKDIPPLVGHLVTNPAIRGHKLPMHPVMEKTIKSYARQSCWRRFWRRRVDTADPAQVAALELLGQQQDWDVRKFKLIKFFELNKGNILVSDKGTLYSHRFFEEFRPKPVAERLAIVADYYLPQ